MKLLKAMVMAALASVAGAGNAVFADERDCVGRVLPLRTLRFPGGNYSALAARGGLAVTCSHWSREDSGGVFDISDPAHVRFLAHIPAKGYSCASPVFFGSRCYVPNNFCATVLDVRDPSHPIVAGYLNPQFPKGGCEYLWVTNGALYFKAHDGSYRVKDDGFTCEKTVQAPPKRVSLKSVKTEKGVEVALKDGVLAVGTSEVPFAYDLSSIAVAGDDVYVYAPDHSTHAALLSLDANRNGLQTFRARVPVAPIARTNAFNAMGMQVASCVRRIGDMLLFDDGIAKLGPQGAVTVVRERTRAACDLAVDGRRVAIAQCAHCRVMDFSDLNRIETVDFAPPSDKPLHLTGCALEGSRLYVAYTLKETPKMDFIYRQPERGFVACYDVGDASHPKRVLELPACISLAKVGDCLYVTGRKGQLFVVDAQNLKLLDTRDDLLDGAGFKVKRFGAFVYLLNGSRIVELDVADARRPKIVRLFERGPGTGAPSYDDFTVDENRLFALAHASVDVFALDGTRDRVPDDCGVKGHLKQPLEAADAALFAGHVAQTQAPAGVRFQAGRFSNCYGAFVNDWVRLGDGRYAVAYGEAGVVLCGPDGRFLAELPRAVSGESAVFAKAVAVKDGHVYVQNAEGQVFLAFPGPDIPNGRCYQ